MTTVNERAMLTRLSISRWGASKHDKNISETVARDYQAQADMGRYTKRLIAKEALETIREIPTQARHHHYEHTLPWLDTGARILPAASYFNYMQEQNAFKAKFEQAVADFARIYPQVRDEARLKLGGLYDAADYLDPSEIAEKFKFDIDVEPMPDASDFRVAISEEEQERVKAQIQERVDAGVQGAMGSVFQRVCDSAEHMMERLRAYDVDADGKVQNPFRDSLVENIRDLVKLLPDLNITNSNLLADMAHRLETDLCEFDAPTLRKDAKARKKVADRAEAIVNDMSAVMS